MSAFIMNDKVYCPMLSTKPFLVYTKNDQNGIFIKFKGVEHWFTNNGLPVITQNFINYKRIPLLFIGTEENRIMLSELYDMEFKSSITIPVYSLNILENGSASNTWVFYSKEGYYDWHSPNQNPPSIELLRHFEIIVTPHTERLKDIDIDAVSKIICVGHEPIENWCNK